MKEEILILTNEDDKECVKCHRILPATSFYLCSATKDGKQSYCKDCMRKARLVSYHYNRLKYQGVEDRTIKDLLKSEGMPAFAVRNIIGLLERTIEHLKTQL